MAKAKKKAAKKKSSAKKATIPARFAKVPMRVLEGAYKDAKSVYHQAGTALRLRREKGEK